MQTKPVKVLAIVCQLNRCGLENRLLDIIRKMDYKKVCIDVYTYRMEKGLLDNEVIALGGKVYYNLPLTPQNMFWYVKYFEKFLREHPEYKIVHAHQDAWCSVFCKGAYLAGVPVRIAHSRTAISVFTIETFVKNVIRIPTRKYATHYFAVSSLAGEWLFGKKNMREKKVEIWKNAIDCHSFSYNPNVRKNRRKELGVEGKKVIIHVGNFNPFKNQVFLVDILEKISQQDDSAMLIFVGRAGEIDLMNRIKERIREKKLEDKILFLGSRSDIAELLQSADVFCFPSFFEGLPGAVLEAQAAGLPCIISSSITKEVCVLNTTVMVNLEQSVDEWANEVRNGFSQNRCNTYETMAQAGFDINDLVMRLTKFYESVGYEDVV